RGHARPRAAAEGKPRSVRARSQVRALLEPSQAGSRPPLGHNAGTSLTHVTTGHVSRVHAWQVALLAVSGVWIGHVVEHFRVDGPGHMAHGLTNSVHVYMLPLGAVLALLLTLAV